MKHKFAQKNNHPRVPTQSFPDNTISVKTKGARYSSQVIRSCSKLTMIIEFMRKQECQLSEHLVMSPDLCLGVADTLQTVKEEVYRIVSDAQKEIDNLKGGHHDTI